MRSKTEEQIFEIFQRKQGKTEKILTKIRQTRFYSHLLGKPRSIYIFHSCPESLFKCLAVQRENVASEYANVALGISDFSSKQPFKCRTVRRWDFARQIRRPGSSSPDHVHEVCVHTIHENRWFPLWTSLKLHHQRIFTLTPVPALTSQSLPLWLSWARLGRVRVPPPLCLPTRRYACPNVAVNEKIDDVRVISWIYYRLGKFQAIRVDAPFLSARNVTITASLSVGFRGKSRNNDNKTRISLF